MFMYVESVVMASGTPTFKPYDQNQLSLLPPSLEDFVAKDHPARILNEIIEKTDITSLNEAYKSRGRASYHPKMLLKVLVYAYITNIYSSRKKATELLKSQGGIKKRKKRCHDVEMVLEI